MMYRSRFEASLHRGGVSITGEITPPSGASAERIRRICEVLNGCVDAVNITDSPRGTVRVCSLAGAVIVRDAGLEPILQLTCRDRNRIAISDDVLGASVLGIRNILALRGDRRGLPGGVPLMDDLDAPSELRLIRELSSGMDLYGREVSPAPEVFVGTVANPFLGEMSTNVRMMRERVDAGAEFIQTQAVYDVERFLTWVKAMREAGIDTPILVGVIPIRSHRSAVFMQENLPGVVIPKRLMERARASTDPKETGLAIALEVIEGVLASEMVEGVHIMTVRWPRAIPEIVRRSGLR